MRSRDCGTPTHRDKRVKGLAWPVAGVPWHGAPTRRNVQRGRREPRPVGASSGLRTWQQPQEHPGLYALAQPETRPSAMEWPDQAWLRHPRVLTEGPAGFQPGGERRAHAYLESFVTDRIRRYARAISKAGREPGGVQPLERVLGVGEPEHPTGAPAPSALPPAGRRRPCTGQLRNFSAFDSRLRWHCHFIQKFEMEDRMEFENVNGGYDLLNKEVNADPCSGLETRADRDSHLVDACMRSVTATGYLNFRMRAMLVSFLTHHLWQPWQEGVDHLAQQFLDFEPGIHYPTVPNGRRGSRGSTRCAFTTLSSKPRTTTRMGLSSASGCRSWQKCPFAICVRAVDHAAHRGCLAGLQVGGALPCCPSCRWKRRPGMRGSVCGRTASIPPVKAEGLRESCGGTWLCRCAADGLTKERQPSRPSL